MSRPHWRDALRAYMDSRKAVQAAMWSLGVRTMLSEDALKVYRDDGAVNDAVTLSLAALDDLIASDLSDAPELLRTIVTIDRYDVRRVVDEVVAEAAQ